MGDKLTVTANRLDIKNPQRIYGLVKLLTGSVLAILLIVRFPLALSYFNENVPTIIDDPETFFESLSPDAVFQLATFSVMGLFLIICLFSCLGHLLGGVKRIFSYFVPTGIPKEIDQINEKAVELFNERSIKTFEKPSIALRLVSRLFSKRLIFLTGQQRVVSEDLIGSIKVWVFWLILLSLPLFVPARMLDEFGEEFDWLSTVIQNWPLPVTLLSVAILVTAVRIFSILFSIPKTPNVEIVEKREHLDNTGNPVNFYLHMQKIFDQLRLGNFLNRKIIDQPPNLGKLDRGETNQYRFKTMIETQPFPIHQGIALNAVALDIGGSVLAVIGFGIFMFLNQFIVQYELGTMADFLLLIITGLVALKMSKRFFKQGSDLHQVFRFKSSLFLIQSNGSYTVSRIGLGDGRGGQLYSERAVVQSDSHIHILAAQLITQCEGLENPRIILDTLYEEAFEGQLNHLLQGILSFEDSGGRLADIDLKAGSFNNIVTGNTEILIMSETVKKQISEAPNPKILLDHQKNRGIFEEASQPQLPERNDREVFLSNTDMKVCPDCGESVRRIARRCRFCNFIFQEAQTENENC